MIITTSIVSLLLALSVLNISSPYTRTILNLNVPNRFGFHPYLTINKQKFKGRILIFILIFPKHLSV